MNAISTTNYLGMYLLIILLIVIVLLVATIVLAVKLGAMRKAYRAMMGDTGATNLEEVLSGVHEQIGLLKQEGQRGDRRLAALEDALKRLHGHIGIHRYNAFNDGGSDLSFSLAIVDEQGSGAVLSGLHSREQTYVYAKPLDKGESKYALSPEEKEAIRIARVRQA